MSEIGPIESIAWADECEDIIVNLYGVNGNAFAILAEVTRAMRKARVPASVINTFFEEATSGDYELLLKTCRSWVTLVHIAPAASASSAIGAFRALGLSLREDTSDEEEEE